jgi:iron complex outermembrane receptor protein
MRFLKREHCRRAEPCPGRSRSSTGQVLTLLVLCLLLPFVSATAQVETADAAHDSTNPLRDLSLEQLGDVKVTTVSKEPEQIWRTAAAIFVLTSEDIQRSGATSIPQALRLIPGVEVGRIDSNQWAVGIRGSESNFSKGVLVLIDGRSVYTPLFAGVYWDVQDVMLEDIDRIEVVRGPGATVWGPNSADGVINIITKKSSETQGMAASVLGGNIDHVVAGARYGGTAGDGLTYRVYGKGFIRGPEYHPDHNNFDEWNQERAGFRLDWTRSTRTEFMLEGDVYGGTSPAETGPATFIASTSGGDIVGRWRHTFENGSDMYLQGYVDRTIRIDSLFGETRNTVDLDFLHHFKLAERHHVSYGFGLHWSPNRFIPSSVLNVLPNVETDHIHTAFVEDEVHLFDDKFLLTAGAKIQHNNFSGLDVQPTIRALWNPSPHQSFWAAVTRAVTTPSRIEEGVQIFAGELPTTPPTLLFVSGNPKFESEKLLGYEGGYRQLFSANVYVDVDVFHNGEGHLQSFGLPTPVGNTLSIFYENAIAGSVNGIEIAPSWTPRQWWKLSSSYSFVGIDFHANTPGLDISSTGSVRTYEGSSPAHQLKIQSKFNIGTRFEFDQSYRYTSALPAQAVRAYQTMDLTWDWKLHRDWNLSIVGQNLFQPYHYEWGTGDPSESPIGIRRAAYVKLSWQTTR